MIKLGINDLEMLYIGIRENKDFNEKDIENSELKKLGTGRILDLLASLKERKLIDLNKDGSFFVTDLAKHALWTDEIPLWLKILRLLEIKSGSIDEIAMILKKSEIELNNEIEKLRKMELILMLPIRKENRIIKTYEILPEGIEKIKKVEEHGFQLDLEKTSDSKVEIQKLLDQVIKEIGEKFYDETKTQDIILKLYQIKEKL
jgi:DNA-binding transcriptional ArsR family regulator